MDSEYQWLRDVLPECTEQSAKRTQPCICTNNEKFDDLPVAGYVNYAMDAVSTIALALNTATNETLCRELNAPNVDCSSKTLTPAEMSSIISYTTFDGLTGPIAFVNGTRPIVISTFDIRQYRFDGSSAQVGFANVTNAYISASRVHFKQPTPQPEAPAPATLYPASVISPEVVEFTASFWTASLTIVSGIMTLALGAMIFIVTYRRRAPAIRSFGVSWLWMLLIGEILVLQSVMYWGIMTATWTCFLKSILGISGWALISSAFAIKARRYISVALRAGRSLDKDALLSYERATHAPTLYEVLTVGGLFCAPMAAMLVLYISDGPQPQIIDTNTALVQYYACETIHSDWGKALALVMTIYLVVLILVSCVSLGLAQIMAVRSGRRNLEELGALFFATLNLFFLYALFASFYYSLTGSSGAAVAQYRMRSLCMIDGIAVTTAIIAYRVLRPTRAWTLERRRRKAELGGDSAAAYAAVERDWRYDPRGGILGGAHLQPANDSTSDSHSDSESTLISETSIGPQAESKPASPTRPVPSGSGTTLVTSPLSDRAPLPPGIDGTGGNALSANGSDGPTVTSPLSGNGSDGPTVTSPLSPR